MPHADYVSCLNSSSPPTDQIGGKAASLARLLALDAPVPPAFAITTEAYRLHTSRLGIPQRASAVADAELPAIRAHIMAEPLPSEVATAITSEITALGAGCSLAVRSSATTEDSPSFSFAGLHDTVLAVESRADAVEEAVNELPPIRVSEMSPPMLDLVSFQAPRRVLVEPIGQSVAH